MRCLVAADGLFLWDEKQPYLLRLSSKKLFGIAGILAINEHYNPPLVSFALQAKLSISHTGIDFHGGISHPVTGSFQPRDALQRLLDGTTYDFVFLDPQTVQIQEQAFQNAGNQTGVLSQAA